MSEILSILSIIISAVAIWISTKVSKKQNKIALFDQKFETYKALKDYFDSSKGWPKAVSKFLTPSVKFKTDNTWAPEINEILGKVSLLFSSNLNDKLIDLQNKYAEVRYLDSCISSYFALLERLDDYQDIRPQFIEYLQDDSPTDDEEKNFIEFCNRRTISTTDVNADGDSVPVSYNFYDLYKKQSDLYREISEAQKAIHKSILDEIKLV